MPSDFLAKKNGAGMFPDPSLLPTLEEALNQKGGQLVSLAFSHILTTGPGKNAINHTIVRLCPCHLSSPPRSEKQMTGK